MTTAKPTARIKTTHRVRLLSPISQAAMTRFARANGNGGPCQFIVGEDVDDPDTVILRSPPFDADEHPNVKLVVRAGTEASTVVGSRVDEGKTCVELTLGANSDSVPEEVLYFALAHVRRFHAAGYFVRHELDYSLSPKEFKNGKESGKIGYETAKADFVGHELHTQTIGLIGSGQIGTRVVNMMQFHKMHVIVFEKDRLSPLYLSLPPNVERAMSMDELLAKADIISIHVPGESNADLIGPRQIELIKPGTGIINCARSEICDSATILAALENKKLCYYSDFPQQDLPSDHPQIMCLPHMGGNTEEAQARCGEMAADQIIDFWTRGNLWPSKNLPRNVLAPADTAVMRLAIPHINRHGVIAPIDDLIAERGINVATKQNSVNPRFGYYIIDLDAPLSEKDRREMLTWDGIIDVMTFTLK